MNNKNSFSLGDILMNSFVTGGTSNMVITAVTNEELTRFDPYPRPTQTTDKDASKTCVGPGMGEVSDVVVGLVSVLGVHAAYEIPNLVGKIAGMAAMSILCALGGHGDDGGGGNPGSGNYAPCKNYTRVAWVCRTYDYVGAECFTHTNNSKTCFGTDGGGILPLM